jgi:S1-C subfamily serine protease
MGFVLGGAAMLAAGVALAASPANEKEEKEVQVVHFPGRGVYLGVVLEDVEGGAHGATVKEVKGDSPAAKAGIKAGDVVVRFDGESVRSVAQLQRLVRETPAGRPVSIEVTRGGATQKLTATLEKTKDLDFGADMWPHVTPPLPPEPPEAPEPPEPPALRWHGHGRDQGFHFEFGDRGPRKLGIRYQEISGQLAKYFHLTDESGILVADVDADGPAGKAGMKAGDVILKIGGKPVRDGDGVRSVVRDLEPGKETTVSIQRDGKPMDLKLTVGGSETEHKDPNETSS